MKRPTLWRCAVAAALLAGAVASSAYQGPLAESFTPLHVLWQRAGEGRVLPALVEAERMHALGRIGPSELAQLLAIAGDESGAERLMAQAYPQKVVDMPPPPRAVMERAVDAIAALARTRRVVILNESHADSRQRAFALALAARLRGLGYTHFGAETFTDGVAGSMRDGAPDAATGVYTADPVFADLVRYAQRIGYVLFPYEQREDQALHAPADSGPSAREWAQARNIVDLLVADPDARVFIFSGGSHLRETVDARGREWMGAWLRRLGGLDPLTVDQNAGLPHPAPARETPLYRSLRPLLPNYVAAVRLNGGDYATRDGVDMVVFHPALASVTARPAWLYMCGYRLPYVIALPAGDQRRLVRAVAADEPAGSTAVDQVLVAAGTAKVELMLPTGRYLIQSQSEQGHDTVLMTRLDTVTRPVSDGLAGYQRAMSCW
ncbi:hypothetical protein [Stenotrophomonas rhizophila]|uniref:hypothetical protein n=1 Tax=Stenotrophomonas rhizophila TaxID=216778 RepID=UPI001E294D08|nr:hypothetical protein [Stenotrophomonas rhizophila]MCC7632786.1 hypothetical protein [Stenotrophomonas rhizophila]MCC7662489.1 hypothetical protein [Stenotrophomonas rhizophila]